MAHAPAAGHAARSASDSVPCAGIDDTVWLMSRTTCSAIAAASTTVASCSTRRAAWRCLSTVSRDAGSSSSHGGRMGRYDSIGDASAQAGVFRGASS